MSFLTLQKPDRARLERFVRAQRTLPVTYPVGSGDLTPTPGFRHTKVLEPLGSGREVFGRAAEGLQTWAVYPAWMTLYPHHAPIREGEVVALVTGINPVWTLSAVRIVAVLRTPKQFSFTLGTLPQHAVTGAERFSVVWADDVAGAELEVLEGCGHTPQEECPQRFLGAVKPWLEGLE